MAAKFLVLKMDKIQKWENLINILCIRPDNLGDVLMTQPAIRALKEQNCLRRITLLTSSKASMLAKLLPEIDEVISFDLPWIRSNASSAKSDFLFQAIKKIKEFAFEGAIIFNNYSQNSLPSAMLAFLADIPNRLGYCRENPYKLLTDWIPDKEPFPKPLHGVLRQLRLVKAIGADTSNKRLYLEVSKKTENKVAKKIRNLGIKKRDLWIIVHPGASEEKRRYPFADFVKTIKLIRRKLGFKIILTGDSEERDLVSEIKKACDKDVYVFAGELALEELIALIKKAPVLVSNNTGPVHIAAGVGTPVLVLYADTNFEHTPWKVKNQILYFNINKNLYSKNQILNYITPKKFPPLEPDAILESVKKLLEG